MLGSKLLIMNHDCGGFYKIDLFFIKFALICISASLVFVSQATFADDFGGGNHVTQSADTLDQWHWAFKPYPGSNPTGNFSSFLLNSLNLGVTRNFEVGFVPLLMSGNADSSQMVRNFNLKYAFYRDSELTFSAGYQSVLMDVKYSDPKSETAYKFALKVHSWSFAGDYRFHNDWRAIYNLAIRFMNGTTQTSGPSAGFMSGVEMPFASETFADNYLDFS